MARDAHLRAQLFRSDGTLVGLTFMLNQPKPQYCYPKIKILLDGTKAKPFAVNMPVHNNFYACYAKAVEKIAEKRGVSKRSKLFHEMEATVDKFMARYNLICSVEAREVQFQDLSCGKRKFY